MIEYSKLHIALEYLKAAIEERELHRRYFAAINLAEIAQEILGKIIRIVGKKDRLSDAVDVLEKVQSVANQSLGWEIKTRRELNQILSSTKNGIKHMDNVSDQNAKLFFEVEQESIWAITNAIENLDILGIYHSKVVSDFVKKYPVESTEHEL